MSNENFVPVQVTDFAMQGLIIKTVMGNVKVSNMTTIPSRSRRSVSFTRNQHMFVSHDAFLTCKPVLQYTTEINLRIQDKDLK